MGLVKLVESGPARGSREHRDSTPCDTILPLKPTRVRRNPRETE